MIQVLFLEKLILMTLLNLSELLNVDRDCQHSDIPINIIKLNADLFGNAYLQI